VRGVFLYTLPFNRPQRKKSQTLDQEIWVAKDFFEIGNSLGPLATESPCTSRYELNC
jgi:hypothetical protein